MNASALHLYRFCTHFMRSSQPERQKWRDKEEICAMQTVSVRWKEQE